jgi:hypothetical protein
MFINMFPKINRQNLIGRLSLTVPKNFYDSSRPSLRDFCQKGQVAGCLRDLPDCWDRATQWLATYVTRSFCGNKRVTVSLHLKGKVICYCYETPIVKFDGRISVCLLLFETNAPTTECLFILEKEPTKARQLFETIIE